MSVLQRWGLWKEEPRRTAAILGSLLLSLALSPRAHAVTAVIDFNDNRNTTANFQLITNGPQGKVTNLNIGGRNAVETGGTSANRFLYVALPKGFFKSSKAVWVVVDYYDQGIDTFSVHYDVNGTDTAVQSYGSNAIITKHDTNAWTTYSSVLVGVDFEEKGPGGADVSRTRARVAGSGVASSCSFRIRSSSWYWRSAAAGCPTPA